MPRTAKARFDGRALSDSEAIELVMAMMAIPGRSGEEAAIMEFIRGKLRAEGVPANSLQVDDVHLRTPTTGQTGNLVLKLPGTRRGPRRIDERTGATARL